MKVRKVSLAVDLSFYKRIEKEKQKFIKENKLDNLSTRAFTGILANKKWINS